MLSRSGERAGDCTAVPRPTLHTDNVGSTALVTTETGAAYQKIIYKSFGEIYKVWDANSGTWQNPDTTTLNNIGSYAFTGQELDSETGLYYYGARYYDPNIGRFISADTIIDGDGLDTQGFNRYSYCRNNPIVYSDPSGNFTITIDGKGTDYSFGDIHVHYTNPPDHETGTGTGGGSGSGSGSGSGGGSGSGSGSGSSGHYQPAPPPPPPPGVSDFFVAMNPNVAANSVALGGKVNIFGPAMNPPIVKVINTSYVNQNNVTQIDEWNKIQEQRRKDWIDDIIKHDHENNPITKIIDVLDQKDKPFDKTIKIGWVVAGVALDSTGGEGKIVETGIKELSKETIKHIINRHSFDGIAKEAQYLTGKQLLKKLENTFFNPKWSKDEIIKAVSEGYNSLSKQGLTGLKEYVYKNERIKIFIKSDGTLDTAYGLHRLAIDLFK